MELPKRMEFPSSAIFAPYNYFEWKPKILYQLKCRDLCWTTMATKLNQISWLNFFLIQVFQQCELGLRFHILINFSRIVVSC